MNLTKALGLLLSLFSCMSISYSQTIFINEFMASNDQTFTDEFGEFDDWIEIYNAGLDTFDIGGKYLTDNLSKPTKWQIPDSSSALTRIPPKGYLIIWLDGDPEQGILHADLKLSADGEQIGLYDIDGAQAIDTLSFGIQQTDISRGRHPDGSSNFENYIFPSPGQTNEDTPTEILNKPTSSINGGIYEEVVEVQLIADDATIYYSIDGSEPNEESLLYTTPLLINKTQTIRAKAFKEGYLPSQILSNTYIIKENISFPVIAFSSDSTHFFGEENGLFPNYKKDIEIPINVEFFDTNGLTGFNQIAEVEIHGSTSAALDQKSLAIKAKGSLGKPTLDYPIFPDQTLTQYRSLILRNSGQDWEYTMFRDALQSSFIRDLSDLSVEIEKPNLDGQAFRPVIAFLNGQYWGIYNLRERLDWRYIKVHYGLDKKEIDLLENLDDAKEGDFTAWHYLDSLLTSKDFNNENDLTALAKLVDLDNYRDYIAFNIFIDNTDWPGNNYRRWKENNDKGKWRWMTKDLDYAFGFSEFNTDNFNTGNPSVNSLDRMLNPTFFYPNPAWATLLFQKLIKNPSWQQDFINRMADQLNVLYTPERMLRRIDEFKQLYQPEIERHNEKWQNVWTWEKDIEVLRTFARGRTDAVRQHFIESIPNITGTSEITLNASPIDGGTIKINTINTRKDNYPWTGTYFNGIDVPIQAIPNPGFAFVGWSTDLQGIGTTANLKLSEDMSITAIFEPLDSSKLNQNIVFPPIANKTLSDSSFTISANASSGLPVDFIIVTGPATIEGNVLSLKQQTGLVIIQAMQNGNERFYPAPPIRQAFEIVDSIPPNNINLTLNCPPSNKVQAVDDNGSITTWQLPNVQFNCSKGVQSIIQNGGLKNGQLASIGSHIVEYTVMDSCGNTSTCNFEIEVIAPNIYCEAKGEKPWKEYIANISLDTFSHNSFKEGYGDFTDMSISLESGKDYEISILPQFSFFQWDEYIKIWIDFNGNNSFIDEDEMVYTGKYIAQEAGSEPIPLKAFISIPDSISHLSTRMRIAMSRDTINDACDIFKFGEVEDYRIEINNNSLIKTSNLKMSVNAPTKRGVKVFPNPAQDILYLEMKKMSKQAGLIKLFNTNGQLKRIINYADELPKHLSIPLSNLANGIYYLKIQQKDSIIITEKFLIAN